MKKLTFINYENDPIYMLRIKNNHVLHTVGKTMKSQINLDAISIQKKYLTSIGGIACIYEHLKNDTTLFKENHLRELPVRIPDPLTIYP